MSTTLQRYPFSLTAGQTVNIPVVGTQAIVLSCQGLVTLRFDNGSTMANIGVKQGYKGARFNTITLTDASGAGNTGYLLISDDDFIDRQVSGSMNIFDLSNAAPLRGELFMCGVLLNGNAPNNGIIQLWNGNAAKNLEVTQIIVKAAGVMFPSALIGPDTVQRPAVATPTPMKLGGAASTGASLCATNVAGAFPIAGITAPTSFLTFGIPATNQTQIITFEEPIVVPPAMGLDVIDGTASGYQFTASFVFRER